MKDLLQDIKKAVKHLTDSERMEIIEKIESHYLDNADNIDKAIQADYDSDLQEESEIFVNQQIGHMHNIVCASV